MVREKVYHERLFALAKKSGIIDECDEERLADIERQCDRWGHRLGWLMALGRLTEEQLESFAGALDEEPPESLLETPTQPIDVRVVNRSGADSGSIFSSWDPESDSGVFEALNALGPYEVEAFLGKGGMGRVFKAWEPQLKRHVALKFLSREDADSMSRFLAEAQAQAKVRHSGVCRVYQVGEMSGYPYISMQYIDGVPLKDIMEDLTLREKIVITRDVCDAVHAAHKTGLIHRDIKPSNVMVERSEDGGWTPYVMDFGLAREMEGPRMTATGLAMGTPAYMAPEQARGDSANLDRRTDVYALGGMLFHMLTGRVVFEGSSSFDVIMKVLATDPVSPRSLDPSVPMDLDTIVMKCLQKEPKDRYDSARALKDDLQRYLDDEPILARPVPFTERVVRKARKHKAMVAVVGAALAVSLVLCGLWLHAQWAARRQAAYAQEFGQQIERLESVLWRTYSLPIHDTAPVKIALKDRLHDMRERLQDMDRTAQGPGHCALGRGFLAIGDLQQAQTELERSWHLGYRTPITAYALGCTLIARYRQAHAGLSNLTDDAVRRQREEDIRRKFRDPAREVLESSRGVELESPAYLEALLAAADGKNTQAEELALRAFDETPYLYQAKLLAGQVLAMEVYRKDRTGDAAGADQAMAEAQAMFDAAGTIAPSDPSIYLFSGRMLFGRFMFQSHSGHIDKTTYQRVLECHTRALQADSGLLESLLRLVDIHAVWSDQVLRGGMDALPACQAALSAARQAVERFPDDAQCQTSLARALLSRGKIAMMGQQDPVDWFDGAANAARRAIELDPQFPVGHQTLALILLEWGNYSVYQMADARQLLDEAEQNFSQAAALTRRDFSEVTNLGLVALTLAENATNFGRDPRPDLQRAAAFFAEAQTFMPDSLRVYHLLGMVYYRHAKYLLEQGEDPRPLVAQSLAAFDAVLDGHPDQADTLFWRTTANGLRANYLAFDSEASPLTVMEQVRTGYRRFLELNPSYPFAHREWADLELLQAQWQVAHGQDPTDALNRAGQQLEFCLKEFDPPNATYYRQARAHSIRARWNIAQGTSADQDLDQAAKYLDLASTTDQWSDYLDLERMELTILRLKSQGTGHAKPDELDELEHRLSSLEFDVRVDREQRDALLQELRAWRQDAP